MIDLRAGPVVGPPRRTTARCACRYVCTSRVPAPTDPIASLAEYSLFEPRSRPTWRAVPPRRSRNRGCARREWQRPGGPHAGVPSRPSRRRGPVALLVGQRDAGNVPRRGRPALTVETVCRYSSRDGELFFDADEPDPHRQASPPTSLVSAPRNEECSVRGLMQIHRHPHGVIRAQAFELMHRCLWTRLCN